MFKTIVLTLVAGFMLLALVAVPTVSAETAEESACKGAGGTYAGGKCSTGGKTLEAGFKDIANTLIFIIGAISVIVIIIGGFRYVVSAGNDQAVAGAKNMVLFAVVGLVVAIMAYAIINFVIGAFS